MGEANASATVEAVQPSSTPDPAVYEAAHALLAAHLEGVADWWREHAVGPAPPA